MPWAYPPVLLMRYCLLSAMLSLTPAPGYSTHVLPELAFLVLSYSCTTPGGRHAQKATPLFSNSSCLFFQSSLSRANLAQCQSLATSRPWVLNVPSKLRCTPVHAPKRHEESLPVHPPRESHGHFWSGQCRANKTYTCRMPRKQVNRRCTNGRGTSV